MFQLLNIPLGNAALVFRRGQLHKVLTVGTYSLWGEVTVETFSMERNFMPLQPLNLLLQHEQLASMLTVVTVAPNEVCLHYQDGQYKDLLMPGRHVYWKGAVDHTFEVLSTTGTYVQDTLPRELVHRHLTPWVRCFPVQPRQRAALYFNGQLQGMLTEGMYYFWKNGVDVKLEVISMAPQTLEVTGQEMLTQDKATLRVNFTVLYKVTDVERALVENQGVQQALYVLAQLALREAIGALTLDALLEQKEVVNDQLFQNLQTRAQELGLTVITTGIKDVILNGNMREIMNQVLVAQKQAEAQGIMRREETASTRSLLNTAKLMEDNPMLFQLKEMEYVERIAERIHTLTLQGGGPVLGQLKDLFGIKPS